MVGASVWLVGTSVSFLGPPVVEMFEVNVVSTSGNKVDGWIDGLSVAVDKVSVASVVVAVTVSVDVSVKALEVTVVVDVVVVPSVIASKGSVVVTVTVEISASVVALEVSVVVAVIVFGKTTTGVVAPNSQSRNTAYVWKPRSPSNFP